MNILPDETRLSLIHRLPNHADVDAWDEFVSLYGPIVHRVALSKGFQAADADNVVQDVLMAVAQSIDQWLQREPRKSFRGWLLTIARNEAVNFLTRRATRPLGANGKDAEVAIINVIDPHELSSEFDVEYERSIFQWAAARVQPTVTEHNWQAFWLTTVEGRSVEDVAATLGMRPANIYIARSRIMSSIKKLVAHYRH